MRATSPYTYSHVWRCDFSGARTHDGRSVRMLKLIDEHTREALLVPAERRWSSSKSPRLWRFDGNEGFSLNILIRQWPGFRKQASPQMADKHRAKTMYIEPSSPWENGSCESFNSKLRDEFLNGESFYSIEELRNLDDSTMPTSGLTHRWAKEDRHRRHG